MALISLSKWKSRVETLFNVGSNLIGGLWRGIQAGWGVISSFFANLSTTVLNWVTGAGTWLVNTGYALFRGFWTGIDTAWDEGVSFFQGLGRAITGAIGDVSRWLTNVGEQIVWGLYNGGADLLREGGRAFRAFGNWAISIGNAILDGGTRAVVNGVGWFARVGGYIVQWIARGIGNTWSWLVDFLVSALIFFGGLHHLCIIIRKGTSYEN